MLESRYYTGGRRDSRRYIGRVVLWGDLEYTKVQGYSNLLPGFKGYWPYVCTWVRDIGTFRLRLAARFHKFHLEKWAQPLRALRTFEGHFEIRTSSDSGIRAPLSLNSSALIRESWPCTWTCGLIKQDANNSTNNTNLNHI